MKIFTCSAHWNPRQWYKWPEIDRINQMACYSPTHFGKGIPEGEAILANIIREHILKKVVDLIPNRLPITGGGAH